MNPTPVTVTPLPRRTGPACRHGNGLRVCVSVCEENKSLSVSTISLTDASLGTERLLTGFRRCSCNPMDESSSHNTAISQNV